MDSCAFCVREGVAEITALEDGTMRSFSREVDEEFFDRIGSVLEAHSVEDWKGGRLFRSFASVIPDTFTLECVLPSGNRYEANAATGFPKNFSEFSADIKALFHSL